MEHGGDRLVGRQQPVPVEGVDDHDEVGAGCDAAGSGDAVVEPDLVLLLAVRVHPSTVGRASGAVAEHDAR